MRDQRRPMARQLRVLVTGINDYNKAAVPVAPTGYNLQSLPAAVNAPIFDSQGWCASDCGLRSIYRGYRSKLCSKQGMFSPLSLIFVHADLVRTCRVIHLAMTSTRWPTRLLLQTMLSFRLAIPSTVPLGLRMLHNWPVSDKNSAAVTSLTSLPHRQPSY
jgi:hypothetical protein